MKREDLGDKLGRSDVAGRAAEEAARAWTFPPSLVNNKPVRFAGYIDFDFKL
jgi:hypothetical protein